MCAVCASNLSVFREDKTLALRYVSLHIAPYRGTATLVAHIYAELIAVGGRGQVDRVSRRRLPSSRSDLPLITIASPTKPSVRMAFIPSM